MALPWESSNKKKGTNRTMYDLYDRILGCLVTAAMGDAVGAPSEAYSRDEILQKFGKRIDCFMEAGDNAYALGNRLGEVTDDGSQIYVFSQAVIKARGNLTVQDAADAIVYWADHYPRYYPRNAGPTTRFVVDELKAGKDPLEVGRVGKMYGRGVSNGATMRVASAGLCNPGNWDGAVQTAVTMTAPTHGTQHAYAAACAIACGIAEGITENASVYSILKACIYGAKKGEEIGLQQARRASGATILPKILKAIECAMVSSSMEEAERLIEEFVGNDGDCRIGTSAAIGLFTAAGGAPIPTILGGANIGGDTDTIGCVAGTLAGAFSGFSALPADWYATFKAANPELDFETVAAQLTEIAKARS